MSDDLGLALVIQAHPDDADISSGATIAQWAREGRRVMYMTCTSGEAGSSNPPLRPEDLGPAREQEQRDAAAVLGVTDVAFLHYPDGRLENTASLRQHVATIILRARPALILTHDALAEAEGHPDHRNLGQAVVAAVAAARHLGHTVSEVWLFHAREANHAVDVQATLELKLEAIACHRTQRSLGEAPPDLVREWARTTGARWNLELAESFRRLTVDECVRLAANAAE